MAAGRTIGLAACVWPLRPLRVWRHFHEGCDKAEESLLLRGIA